MKTKTIIKRALAVLLTVLMLLSCGIASISAATVELAETGANSVASDGHYRLYFKFSGGSTWWNGTGCYHYAWVWGTGISGEWCPIYKVGTTSTASTGSTSDVFYMDIPSGTMTYMKLIRAKSASPGWSNYYNATGDIQLPNNISTYNLVTAVTQDSSSVTQSSRYLTVAPSSYSATVTNAISGSGTSSDPYVVYNGQTMNVSATSEIDDHNFTVTYGYDSSTQYSTSSTGTVTAGSDTTSSFNVYYTPLLGGNTSYKGTQESETIYYKAIPYTFTYTVTAGEGGSVSPESGSATQTDGVTITATPDTGYDFEKWTVTNGSVASSTSASTTFYPSANGANATASFVPENYTVTVSGSPEDGGSVTKSSDTVDYGETVTLTANPDSDNDYAFTGWDIDGDYEFVTGNASTASVTIKAYSAITATANFLQTITYTVSASANISGAGSVSPTTQEVPEGSAILLTATPNDGYRFDSWSINGDYTLQSGSTSDQSISIIPQEEVTAVANFVKTYTVTFVDGLTGETISTQTVDSGASADAPTAPGHDYYNFTGWDKAYTNITANTTVTAEYEGMTFTVTVTSGNGGSAEAFGASVQYPNSVTLTAEAEDSYNFSSWSITGSYDLISGDVNTAEIEIIPKADITAQANFVEGQYLTVHSFSDSGLKDLTVTESNGTDTKTFGPTAQLSTTTFNDVVWDTSAVLELTNGFSSSVTATLSGTGTGDVSDPSTWYKYEDGTHKFLYVEGYRTIVCTNNNSWSDMYAHIWGTSDLASWPGTAMTYCYTNDYGQGVYVIIFDAKYDHIIFNNNNNGQQTGNIDLATYNITSQGYYLNSDNSYGTWDISTFTASASTDAIELSDVLYNSDGTWAGETEVWITEDGEVTLRRDLLDLVDSMTDYYNGGKNSEDYTDASWTDFVEAYESAYDISGSADSNQDDIDNAATALQEAYDALEKQSYYTLAVSQTGGLGTVTVDSKSVTDADTTLQIAQGKTINISVTAPVNYYIVSIGGVATAENLPASYTGTATVSANGTLDIVYAKNPTVTVDQAGGTATIGGNDATDGELVSYNASPTVVITAPDLQYIASIVVNGESVYTNENNDETVTTYNCTINNVTADTDVTVTFADCTTYDITVTYASAGGTLYYNGEVITSGDVITVRAGETVVLTAEPVDGYAINYWLVDSNTSGRELTYTLSNVSEDHTVGVEWKELETIKVSVDAKPYAAGTASATSGILSAVSNGTSSFDTLQYSSVSLVATVSDPCYKFVNWTFVGGYDLTSGTISDENITITANTTVTATANFELAYKKIYLVDQAGWGSSCGYSWVYGETGSVAWPGTSMTYSFTNDDGYKVYEVLIPLADDYIIFYNSDTNRTGDLEIQGNIYNNSSQKWNNYVTDGYYLQGTWNGTDFSAYDLQKFEQITADTYTLTITVTSTEDGYIYVNPTNQNSDFWVVADGADATANNQILEDLGEYTATPNQVKVLIDANNYQKAYDVTFTFNPTTGEFSWTKVENTPSVTVIGTDGMGKTSADDTMVSSNGRVGDTYFEAEDVKSITESTFYQSAQVSSGNPVTFYTQVNKNASGTYDYYVAGWVINGVDFVSATALGNGLYNGSYVFTEDSDVVPVYFHTSEWLAANGVSTTTVYAVVDKSIENWQDYMAAYTWYKDSDVVTYEQFGAWPGQLMIPVAGLDGVYYTYIENTDADGVHVSGVSFNNYASTSNFDVSINEGRPNIQTYDYYDFVALLEDNQQNITFVLKNTNNTVNNGRVSETSVTLSNFNFVEYTDYSGLKTDIFGNNIEENYDSLDNAKALYIVQTGNNSVKDGTLSGDFYVQCYLYDATGAYLGKCYSYELHDKDSALWTTVLAEYENQKAFISYEALTANSDGSATRYDGEWYGDTTVSVTINLSVNVALTTDGGDTYEIDTEVPVNEADYGAGYINVSYQTVDVTRGSTVTLLAIPKVGYKFIGWYTADGNRFATNTAYTVTAAVGTTYTAVFEKLAEDTFHVNHYIYQGVGTAEYIPPAHGGNAVLYVGIQNVTKGTNTGLITGNSASIEAQEGNTLIITIATDGIGADKFFAWYTDAVNKYGETTFEEVGVDSDDNLYENNGTVVGRTDIVYFQFEYIVSDVFSMNLYSDLIPTSVEVSLVYQYNDRYGNVKEYVVPYILTAEEIEGFAGNGGATYTPAYISSATNEWVNTILDNAPYIEDYYKDTTWIINSAMYNTMTFNLWATQPYSTYTVTAEIDKQVIVSQVPYNTILNIDARDYLEDASITGFWYNDVNNNGTYDKSVDIILTYGPQYGYRVTQDMSINYESVDSLDFNVSLDAPVYGREQATDDNGTVTTDKVYVDYLINILTPYFYGQDNNFTPIYDGEEVTDDWNGQHVTIESLKAAGYDISFGVITEQVCSFLPGSEAYPTFADAEAAAKAKGYKTATSDDTLTGVVESYTKPVMLDGKYYTVFDATNYSITNKNRVLFTISYNNTETNRKRFCNVYSYVTVTYNGTTATYISNVQTLNIYETAVSDAVVNNNTTFA